MSRANNAWICDEPGCVSWIELEPSPTGWFTRAEERGWYKLAHSFISHRCPAHAGPWRAYDIARQDYEKAREVEWDRARDAFEIEWMDRYEAANPPPKMPGVQ